MAYDGTLKFDTKLDTTGFQTGVSKIGTLAGTAFKATTAVIGGAATAIGAFGASSLKAGMSFDSSMSNVAAISGATGKEFESLEAKALEMGAKTKFSASESADAFSYMAMAGWKTEDMLNGIEGIMSLAAASGEDLATTSDIVTDALTAFGMSAQDSGHFADIMAAASSNANTNVHLMGETFKYVAPVAGALGFSAEDTAVAIGLMANAGIKGSMAGTSLRSTFTRLAKPTKEVYAAMDKLGVSLTDDQGNVKDLNVLMGDLRKGFSGLTDAEKAQYAAMIAGQQGMSGLLAIVNASDDDVNKLSDAIGGCTDELTGYSAAAEMARRQNDNLKGDVTILKSSYEGLQIAVAKGMTASCRSVVQEATKMVNELKDAFGIGGMEGLVKKAGMIFGRLATEALKAAPKLIDAAVSLIDSFLDSIMNGSNDFAGAAGQVLAKLAEAFIHVSGRLWECGVELIRKMLEGLADSGNAKEMGSAAGKAIKNLVKSIKENGPAMWEAAKQIVKDFCKGLQEEFPGVGALLEGFLEGFMETIEGIASTAGDILGGIFDAINEADPESMKTIGKAMGEIAAAMVAISAAKTCVTVISGAAKAFGVLKTGVTLITSHIPQILAFFGAVAGKVSSAWAAIAGFFGKVGTAVSGLGSSLSGALSSIGTFFTADIGATLAGGGVAAVGTACAAIVAAVVSFFSGAEIGKKIGAWIFPDDAELYESYSGITGTLTMLKDFGIAVKDLFVMAWEDASRAIGNAWDSLKTAASEKWGALKDTASQVVEGVCNWFQQLPYRLGVIVGEVLGTFVKWGGEVSNFFTTTVPQWINTVCTWFAQLPGRIWTFLTDVYTKCIQWGAQMLNQMTTIATNCFNAVVNWFAQLPGRLWTFFQDIITKAIQWGSQLLNTCTTAAMNAYNAVVNWFSQLPGKLWSFLQTIITNVIQWGSQLLSNMSTAASNAVNAVCNYISQLPGKIQSYLSDVLSRVASWASELAAKGAAAASALCSAVIDGVSSLPGKMAEIGSNIVQGVWNGISGARDWFYDKVYSFFSGIVDGAKKSLGIESPSKVMAREVGRWIPPGVAKGMEAAMPSLISTADEEMAELAEHMKAAVSIETGAVTRSAVTQAQHKANITGMEAGPTYHTENFEQNNTYNVPVATPSEIAKTQRATARMLLGGVT